MASRKIRERKGTLPLPSRGLQSSLGSREERQQWHSQVRQERGEERAHLVSPLGENAGNLGFSSLGNGGEGTED